MARSAKYCRELGGELGTVCRGCAKTAEASITCPRWWSNIGRTRWTALQGGNRLGRISLTPVFPNDTDRSGFGRFTAVGSFLVFGVQPSGQDSVDLSCNVKVCPYLQVLLFNSRFPQPKWNLLNARQYCPRCLPVDLLHPASFQQQDNRRLLRQIVESLGR